MLNGNQEILLRIVGNQSREQGNPVTFRKGLSLGDTLSDFNLIATCSLFSLPAAHTRRFSTQERITGNTGDT